MKDIMIGRIIGIISSDFRIQESLAEGLGKKEERNSLNLYYKITDWGLIAYVTPNDYPEKFSNFMKFASVVDEIYVAFPENPSWADGEALLLGEALGVKTNLYWREEKRRSAEAIIKGLNARFATNINVEKKEKVSENLTVVSIDKYFKVKGVGLVSLGFVTSGTLKKGQEIRSLPTGRYWEVKSIQVLDKDYDSVGEGIRVGIALKGEDIEALEGSYCFYSGVETTKFLRGNAVSFKFSKFSINNEVFVVGRGIYVQGKAVNELKPGEEGEIEIELKGPIPVPNRYAILSPNVPRNSTRVLGYINST